MSEKKQTSPETPAARTAANTIRAAGLATLVSGLLFGILALSLAQQDMAGYGIALWLVVGAALTALGIMTLWIWTWALWPALLIGAGLLGAQLYAAYGGGNKPTANRVSVFFLTIPLIILIANALALGAARKLRSANRSESAHLD